MMNRAIFIFTIILLMFSGVNAQKYSFSAQKAFIPKDLGSVYLGMPFDNFAKQYDLEKAEVGDTRFDWLELSIPVEGSAVQKLTVRIHGLSQEDKKEIIKKDTLIKTDDLGYEYEVVSARLVTAKIPAKAFVYAMYIDFKKDFDLKNYALKTFGKNGEVRQSDDPYHFFDIQWTRKTSDGLTWLIRSFHEKDSRSLQLLGRINGTEWGID